MSRFLPSSPLHLLISYRYKILQSFLLVFLFAFVFYKAGVGTDGLLVKALSSLGQHRVSNFIHNRLEEVQSINKSLAYDDTLAQDILSQNTSSILTRVVKAKDQYDLGFITVTDQNGFVLSRAHYNNKRGDNVYLNSPNGYEVGSGKTIAFFDENILNPQEGDMAVGQPVLRNGVQVGSVFSGDFFDAAFAKKIQQAFINPQTQIVFYSKNKGALTSSFPQGVDKELSTILNPGSTWIASGHDGGVIVYRGSYYYVRNLPLTSYDGTVHIGALILFPLYVHLQFVIVIFCTLLLLYYVWKPVIKATIHSSRKIHFLEIVLLGIFTLYTVVIAGIFYGRVFLQTKDQAIPELSIYNSTMHLSPESGVYEQGGEQNIRVMVDTGGEDVNSVGAKLTYDPDKLKIIDIDTSTSECDQYLEKSINAETGKIRLICMLHPGATHPASFDVGTLVVEPIASGDVTIHIDDNSQVLANDGFATNVLRQMTDATYAVVDGSDFSWNDTLIKSKKLVVHSPSHPNEARWYSKNTISFIWSFVPNALFSYTLTDLTTGKVALVGTTTQNTVSIPSPGSSQYEMKVRASSKDQLLAEGSTTVRVDTTPPDNVEVVVSHYSIKVGEVVRMILKGDDSESGLAANYYVSVDGNTLLPVGGLVFLPFSSPGIKEITVRIFDKAGNYADVKKYIRVGT